MERDRRLSRVKHKTDSRSGGFEVAGKIMVVDVGDRHFVPMPVPPHKSRTVAIATHTT